MIVILDAAQGDDAAVEAARAVIKHELGHPSNVVMLIAGERPEVATLATDAGMLAGDVWRRVIWVRKLDILDGGRLADLGGNDAVLYDRSDAIVQHLNAPVRRVEIDAAFRKAENR